MALPRFTIFVAPHRGRPGRPMRAADIDVPEQPLSWRLLAANNRDVARSAVTYPDLSTCLQAVSDLQARVDETVAVAARSGRADWSWRLRLDGQDVAMSSRTYQRRLQCEAACALFVTLVRDATTDMFEHIAATGADLATIASRLPAARVEPSPDNAGALPARRPPTHTA
ncbi:MAG TPA: hypothetical protein VKB59_19060 [Micromonosporaceae bacterium]|nr:hypothetical protein [Micromonosporaceae bacterium]